MSLHEIDVLVDIAVAATPMAARLTGGGFGGAIVALVDDEAAANLGRSSPLVIEATGTWPPSARFAARAQGSRSYRAGPSGPA